MVGVIGFCYLIELFYANPPLLTVAKHAVVPQFQGTESVLLAVGILGATVMPHVIYLHSSLTQSRIVPETTPRREKLLRYTRIDVIIAMTIAGLINMAMLVMAASTFFENGLTTSARSRARTRRSSRCSAARRRALRDRAASARGSRARPSARSPGQVVMQGFIRAQIPICVRRLVTMAPAFIAIGIGVDPSRTLVISQVVLSFGIPFALVPLVMFTSAAIADGRARQPPLDRRRRRGGLIVALNIFLLARPSAA